SSLSCSFCQCLDTSVVQVSAPVKNHGFYILTFCPFGDQLTDFLGLIGFGSGGFNGLLLGGGGHQRRTSHVIDDLTTDPSIGPVYRQPWFFSCAIDFPTDSVFDAVSAGCFIHFHPNSISPWIKKIISRLFYQLFCGRIRLYI